MGIAKEVNEDIEAGGWRVKGGANVEESIPLDESSSSSVNPTFFPSLFNPSTIPLNALQSSSTT